MTVYPEIIPGDRSRIINYVVIALMNGIGDAFLALPTIRFIQCIAGPENVHNPRANLGKCHDLRSLAGREDETESIATEPRTSTRVGRPRREDTPPGGAFVFELWKKRKTENYLVRIYYTAQTLEQMRSIIVLTPDNPPQRVPVFLPGCSQEGFSCTWPAFSRTIRQSIDSRHVHSK
jgi:hypothetical protein